MLDVPGKNKLWKETYHLLDRKLKQHNWTIEGRPITFQELKELAGRFAQSDEFKQIAELYNTGPANACTNDIMDRTPQELDKVIEAERAQLDAIQMMDGQSFPEYLNETGEDPDGMLSKVQSAAGDRRLAQQRENARMAELRHFSAANELEPVDLARIERDQKEDPAIWSTFLKVQGKQHAAVKKRFTIIAGTLLGRRRDQGPPLLVVSQRLALRLIAQQHLQGKVLTAL